MRITIEFPFIAKNQTANIKNKRTSDFLKTKQKNEVKRRCETIAYLAKKNYKIESPFFGCVLNITWEFKTKRGRDYDNYIAGTKYYTDALVSQGLIVDDNHNHLILGKTFFADGKISDRIIYYLELLDKKEFCNLLDYRKKQNDIFGGFYDD